MNKHLHTSEASVVVYQMCLSCEMPLHEEDTSEVLPNFQLIWKSEQVAGMNKQAPLEQKLFTEVEDLTFPNVRLFVLQCMTLASSCWVSLGRSKALRSCAKHGRLVQRCTSARAQPWRSSPAAPAFCHSHARSGWWTSVAGLPLSMMPILLLLSLFLACWYTRTLCEVYLHSILVAALQPTSCPCTVKITSSVPSPPTWGHYISYLSYPHS